MTNFKVIRDFVRAILGDTDADCYQYSDDVLNQNIRLTLLCYPDATVIEDGSLAVFTTVLSTKNKGLLSYMVAKGVIAPIDDHFSYKTPVISVVRKGGIKQLHSHIENKIGKINGGAFALSSDTDLEALINGTERFLDEFSTA